jgi:hypothetical protein
MDQHAELGGRALVLKSMLIHVQDGMNHGIIAVCNDEMGSSWFHVLRIKRNLMTPLYRLLEETLEPYCYFKFIPTRSQKKRDRFEKIGKINQKAVLCSSVIGCFRSTGPMYYI